MANPKTPRGVDVHVGNRVRVARQAREMTQGALARQLGITFQQVQKYENGGNRISAGRLRQIADIMDLPITFFFDGVSETNNKIDPEMTRANRFLATPEGTLIANAFPRLGKRTQQAILDLVRAGGGR